MRKSLTLIEVLVAVTIFSFISVSLYSLLHTGIKVRKKLTVDQKTFSDIYLRLEMLGHELRNIISFFPGQIQLNGDKESMDFYTLKFDYLTNTPKISNIIYEFKEGILTKTVKAPFKDEPETVFNFIEDLEQVNFYYFNPESEEGQKWQNSWEEVDSFPQGVKVEVIFTKEQGKKDYLEKYIFIDR